ncbi:MAG: amidohydrolase [Candidatus Cloacimonetes bacterium]|jgi:N-acetyldiaminopimelate deacetylase|nr:amidohydrolase [Candidatus Cloacimonadota bacterium]
MNLYKIRKELHKIPELGFEEIKTQKYILQLLKKIDGIIVHTFDFPGILIEYSHGNGKYKMFRADMDALPISEDTNCGFESEHKGKMHACGHDMHMTILIGLIEKIIQANLKENILFLFQPAEEGMGGATRILNTGILDKFEINESYALHVFGGMETGEISSKAGIFFANTQEIEVVFTGKSAHVAFAEKGINALAAGAEFYLEIEEAIKKKFPIGKPVICSFGKMNAGVVMNAVPDECRLEGTFRAFTNEDHEALKTLIEQVKTRIAEKHKIKADIIYKAYYKEVVNNEMLLNKLKSIASEMCIDFQDAGMVFTGEDFGFFTEKYKGLLFWLGVGNNGADLHSPQFLPDEKAIDIGVDLFFELIKTRNEKSDEVD